jgi:diaminopimelate epimerase
MGRIATESFDKYEGLGNDFVVVAAAAEESVSTEWARAICDRRRGVGGDGILVLLPARAGGDARMRVINSDGSIPEMCGNGLRCAALHVARARGIETGELTIETDAGPLRCAIERRGDDAIVLADMGIARVIDDVVVDGVELTRVDVGNPHAVSFRPVARDQFERLGPTLSTAPAFERGTNVEFVQIERGARVSLDVLVWERGAGPTLACGTGACAAVAAARSKGHLASDGPVVVRLPGGELEIALDATTGRTTLRGPARRVFGGRLAGGAS